MKALLTQQVRPWGTVQGPMASSAAPAQERHPSAALKLLADQFGTEYMGPVGVGSRRGPKGEVLPEAVLQVIFDTGSADLWVASDLCTSWPCTRKDRPRFNHTRSETFLMPKDEVNVGTVYGSGQIHGVVGTDDVHLGPFVARKQAIGLITEEKGALFSMIPLDGILGLGFASMAIDSNLSPLFDNLVKQQALPSPEFAFYLHPDVSVGGAVLWGSIDERLFEGPLVWYPVVEEGWWALEVTAVRIGNRTFEAVDGRTRQGGGQSGKLVRPQLIVDSGTTFLTATGELWTVMQQAVRQMRCSEVGALPPFVYTVKDSQGDARNISVPPEEYMVKVPDQSGRRDLCAPGIMEFGEQFGPALAGRTPLILGEIFMRHHFTVFRRSPDAGGRAEVGIARSAKGPGAQAFLREAAGAGQ